MLNDKSQGCGSKEATPPWSGLKNFMRLTKKRLQGPWKKYGGESGIRTHGTAFRRYTRFPVALLRPTRTSLRDSSEVVHRRGRRERRGLIGVQKNISALFAVNRSPLPTEYGLLILGGEGGIRTHVPRFWQGKSISSRPRYDHFGTSPCAPILFPSASGRSPAPT